MATFTFVCPSEHETDREVLANERRPKTVRCRRCGRRARHSIAATLRGSLHHVDMDLEPHFNDTFGRGISSRRQLADAQKRLEGETGKRLMNYEPVRGRSSDWLDKAAGKDRPPALPHGITPDMRVRDHPSIRPGFGADYD